MLGSSTRRDLRLQFSAEGKRAESKMAAVTQPRDQHSGGQQEHRQALTPATLAYTHLASTSITHIASPSPASTESLIERSMDTHKLSPMGENPDRMDNVTTPEGPEMDILLNAGDLYLKLSELLDRGLTHAAKKITNDMHSDFHNLGSRMEAIEHKLDITVSRANQNTDHIQVMQEQLDTALTSINDLENCSRRDNFGIRGLPKSTTDIPKTVQELIKTLILSIAPHKLELDRAHRSLGPPRKDGAPRDVVV